MVQRRVTTLKIRRIRRTTPPSSATHSATLVITDNYDKNLLLDVCMLRGTAAGFQLLPSTCGIEPGRWQGNNVSVKY